VRRAEILAATTDLLDRIGLAAIRVADVAGVLGVSPALVFYHFGTKDALVADAFAHAVDRDLRRLDQAVAKGSDPVDRLRRVLRLYGPTGAASGWRVWIDAWALAQHEPVIHRVLRRLDQRWSTVLLEVVEDGVADGAFTCEDPAASVARVSALLDGLSVATLVYRSVSRAQLREWVARAVAVELGIATASLL
jgi:AcrR family transcriptional regulator